MTLNAWFERRLVVVSGKGGVGRSTLVAALGLQAAKRGKRTCIVELSGAREVAELLGLDGRSYSPRPVTERLAIRSLTAPEALDDFGQRKLGLGRIFRRVLNNRVSRAFLDAVPGLHDLLQLGKVENTLTEPVGDDPHYDLILLDAPATGHGLTLLSSATSMAAMTRVGPFHDLATIISQFLSDPERTALVLATLPEALPVHECVEATEALQRDGAALAGVVVNRVRPSCLPSSPPWATVRPVLHAAGGPWTHTAALADQVHQRLHQESEAIASLRAALPREVPMLLTPLVDKPDPISRTRAVSLALEQQ